MSAGRQHINRGLGRITHSRRGTLVAAKVDLLRAACETWVDADWRERPAAHTALLEAVREYVRTTRAP